MDPNALIVENMALAERIGLKYASRNSRHPDEAVAEAYYALTVFFKECSNLYLANPDNYHRTLGIFIKRMLIKYFERENTRMSELTTDKIERNTDEEMIEYLSGIMTDDEAFQVFHHLRNGVSLMDVDMVDPLLRKIVKRLRIQITGRIRRIEELQKAGIKTSREIYYDRSLEDGSGECPEADRAT